MPRTPRTAIALAATTALVAAASTAVAPSAYTDLPAGATRAPSGGERMSILYETDPAVQQILGGSEPMRTLPWLFRQEPSNSGAGAQLASNDQRMVKISGAALFRKTSAGAMRTMLQEAIDRTCVTPAGVNTCGAHRVGVDEIGTEWGVSVGDATTPSTPAMRLRDAMTTLWATPYPGGGSYASRVHFYVAPGVSTSIAAGQGANRTLGDDGKEHFRDYSALMPALQRAGGVWLEMYHYPRRGSARTPFSDDEWNDVPVQFASFMRSKGRPFMPPPRTILHFVMTGGNMPVQWQRAQAGAVNPTILGNGPASFKLSGTDAAAYGAEFRKYFALG